MDDLVRWLGEQLSVDEERARACAGNGEWAAADIAIYGPDLAPEVRAHMAAHDPARVLREIDAKRALIARGGPFCTSDCDEPGNEPKDPDTNWTTPLEHHFDCGAYKAAGVLAVVYADRPGYREEWRP
ncbi:hypothetical protein DV517_61960 [Streptomyces sp. S816]|uniref:DUF6221 family protein n=1 Tax=Streptomyces sp. S816 TaxID=2283197 RepID=UPI00109C4F2D|nr:DUF6221 family protein [Streptomyces sp. S816]TGZ14713.1 hypothetical protein DV517_61960 [Streptomyces sp. S816]